MKAGKALGGLCICAYSPEPPLVAYAIRIKISCACPFIIFLFVVFLIVLKGLCSVLAL